MTILECVEIAAALWWGAALLVLLASFIAALLFPHLPWQGPGREPLRPVTAIVPIKAMHDSFTEDQASLFAQDYPQFEILVTAAEMQSEALSAIREVRQRFPAIASHVVQSGVRHAASPKLNNLWPAIGAARHDLILTKDCNIRLAPGDLENLVHHHGPGVGLVSTISITTDPESFGAWIETSIINCYHARMLMLVSALGLGVGCGKIMLFSRAALDRAGGLDRSGLGHRRRRGDAECLCRHRPQHGIVRPHQPADSGQAFARRHLAAAIALDADLADADTGRFCRRIFRQRLAGVFRCRACRAAGGCFALDCDGGHARLLVCAGIAALSAQGLAAVLLVSAGFSRSGNSGHCRACAGADHAHHRLGRQPLARRCQGRAVNLGLALLDVVVFASLAFVIVIGLGYLSLPLLFFLNPRPSLAAACPPELPAVLVQLAVFNEPAMVPGLLDCVAALDWPKDRLHIQLLDDSFDETTAIAADVVARLKSHGFSIDHRHRSNRAGFKAGALAAGMAASDAPFIAVLDADFRPPADWLKCAMGYFFTDPRAGFVQSRFEFSNRKVNALTRMQGLMSDAHFVMEQDVRARACLLFQFNGTAGVLRREAVLAAGGWSDDSLAEDLDLVVRMEIAGWHGVFVMQPPVLALAPESVHDWRVQQRRWASGFAQVARKLLAAIARANWTLPEENQRHVPDPLSGRFRAGNSWRWPDCCWNGPCAEPCRRSRNSWAWIVLLLCACWSQSA